MQKKNKDFCCTRTSLLIGEPISSHRCAGRYPFVKTCQRPFSSGIMLFLICIASKHCIEHINPIVNISIYKLVYDALVVLLQIISNSFMRSLFLFADILSAKGNIGGSGGNSFVLVNLICLISRAAANPRLLE